MHAEVVGHGTANQNACTDTDIPTAQVGAVCGSALIVAGEVHAHGLVARENQAEACPNQERGYKEGDGRVAEREDKVGNHVQRHAGTYQVNQVTAVNEAARHNAVQDETRCNQGIEPARAANAKLLGVKGDVVGDGTIGEAHKNEVYELRNGAGQEETV